MISAIGAHKALPRYTKTLLPRPKSTGGEWITMSYPQFILLC